MPDLASREARGERPQFRNISPADLARYKLPLPGIVSILHRVSGAVLFLVGLPFVLYLFEQSLTSELSFQVYRSVVSHWFAKLVLLGLIWAYLHHFCAGIRYLLLDVHVGVDKASAKTTASVVMGVSLAITAVIALKLFGVF
ncbi:MAG TPA: succinate dehydrogenase, cytochrome b556 subunit [Burkholderiaceae bacterium]